MKCLDRAKSRLAPPGGVDRTELALAFALDTAMTARSVTSVTVVCDDARIGAAMARESIDVTSDGAATDLNEAVRFVTAGLGRRPIAVLTADLPAIRSGELRDALRRGRGHATAFVTDAEGTGTVLLMGGADLLRPRFGSGSAERHRDTGAVELTGDWPGLRRDVDTLAHLRSATTLGVGPRTARLLSGIGPAMRALDHV